MKVALYARKSKGEEPEAQMDRLRNAATQKGHETAMEASDVASGRDPNRAGWRKIMAAVRGGHVRAVWITKTDRAMRSTHHYLEAAQVFLDRGCHLLVLDQPQMSILDRDDPMARAFRTMGAAFAQLEVDLADERSNEGHTVRDGRTYGPSGAPVGRPVKYGQEHRFRVRTGRREHDRARCRACGETGGLSSAPSPAPKNVGVGKPNGSPTPDLPNPAGGIAGVQKPEAAQPANDVEVAAGARP